MQKNKYVPRGIRNNNPLNIRIGNTWLGERQNPTDPNFEEFVTMFYGLRAAFIILRRYINRYHRNTIRMIVATWAPANENNTQKYIDTVAARMGCNPDTPLSYSDKDAMCRLVAAMAYVENGQPISDDQIREAYDRA